MKTNAEGNPCHGIRPWLWGGILFLAWLLACVGFSKAKPPEKIKIAVIGTVAKPGAYPLEPPVTVEAAFKVAGGWSGEGEGGMPPKHCILTQQSSKGTNKTIKVTVRIDRLTKIVEVTDKTWKTKAIPAGSVLTLPEIIF